MRVASVKTHSKQKKTKNNKSTKIRLELTCFRCFSASNSLICMVRANTIYCRFNTFFPLFTLTHKLQIVQKQIENSRKTMKEIRCY